MKISSNNIYCAHANLSISIAIHTVSTAIIIIITATTGKRSIGIEGTIEGSAAKDHIYQEDFSYWHHGKQQS